MLPIYNNNNNNNNIAKDDPTIPLKLMNGIMVPKNKQEIL